MTLHIIGPMQLFYVAVILLELYLKLISPTKP